MKKLTGQELRDYFKENNYFIRYKNKVEILIENPKERGVVGEVSVTLPIDAGRGQKVIIDLVAEYKTMEEFIEQSCINSIDDLRNIRRSVVSSQVIKGSGFFNCMVKELDNASICFRVKNGITEVYSTDLHYYDEYEKSLTLPEQFIEYIEERMERLKILSLETKDSSGFQELKNW